MFMWVLLLFLGGMVLILAEFIVPGGICGIIGAAMLIASSVLSWFYFNEYFLFIGVGQFVSLFVVIILGMYLLPHSPFAKFLILTQSADLDKGWVVSESDQSLVGRQGEAFTKLRPAGTVVIDGKRIGAVSEGEYIDKGATVQVIEVHGNRVVVEELKQKP